MARDRGGGLDMNSGCSPREAQFFGDDQKIAQMTYPHTTASVLALLLLDGPQ
jgi:hypothetical protein